MDRQTQALIAELRQYFDEHPAEIQQGKSPACFLIRVYDDSSPEPRTLAVALQRMADASEPAAWTFNMNTARNSFLLLV